MQKTILAFVLLLLVNVTAGAKDFGSAEERVMEAYLAYYGRPADPEGLEYWSNRLETEGGNIDSIITAFGESKEYNDRFGSLSKPQLVSNIYQQLFGRDPDQSGLDFYVEKLNNNEMTIQAISLAILDGVTGNDQTIIDNKLSFSRFYVEEGSADTANLSAVQLAENIAKIDEKPETLNTIITLYRRIPVLARNNNGSSQDTNNGNGNGNATNTKLPTIIENVKEATADTEGPLIAIPGNISVEASSKNGANVSFAFNAVDSIDGAVSVNCSNTSGSIFPIGTTSVLCSANDKSGNNSSDSFSITVVDSTEPKLVLPPNLTIDATESTGIEVHYQASATDTVDQTVSVNCAPLSGSVFEIGNTSVKCDATDGSKNVVSGGFVVTVIAADTSDASGPALFVPDNLVVEASNASGTVVNYSVSAKDDIDGTVAVNCAPASGQNFVLGVTTVTCDATDNAGNKSTKSFTAAVVDTTAPQLQMPANMQVNSTESAGAVIDYQVVASDNIDQAVSAVCAPLSGSVFAVGDTSVKCEATDSNKNVATAGFLVTVVSTATADTTAPTLSIPSNISVEAATPYGATVSYSVSATDETDGAVTASCSRASGKNYVIGVTTVTCDATDNAGNTSTKSFTVSVIDSTVPQLSVPANMLVDSTETTGITVAYQVGASDNVDQTISAVCTPLSGSVFVIGDTTVDCEVTDRAGNSVADSFLVSVAHTPAPVEDYVSSVTVSWSIPTTRENGDPLMIGELVGYELYIIAEASGDDQLVAINDPLTTSKIIEDLSSDTYHFSISSIDSSGQKSEPSDLISTAIQAP